MLDTQALLRKVELLTPEQVRQVEEFVEFLAAKVLRKAAPDRLFAIAPALVLSGA